MSNGHDDICAADLANVVEGRGLGREDAGWLARAITGAIRPNRDKPFWDFAHFCAVLGQAGHADGRRIIDLLLDPRLARADAVERHLVPLLRPANHDARGLVLTDSEAGWRTSWSGAARLFALGEFLITMDGLAAFKEISGWFDELVLEPASPAAIDLLVKRLTRQANLYRQSHVPLAPVERRFRAILTFLGSIKHEGGRKDAGGFDDADILAYWRSEVSEGERPQFRTVAEHFVTFEKVAAVLGGLKGITDAASLDSIEDWADRLDAMLGDLATGDDAAMTLAEHLAAMPETPKILTGAERDDLIDLLWLEPFHRSRPLTVLRAISFGRVQSGIANRLRRGSGGASIAERVDCSDAEPYADIVSRSEALAEHVRRMIRIAAMLRLEGRNFENPKLVAMLKAAEADIRKVRRAGFEDREALAKAFALVDETLARVAGEIDRFRASAEKSADIAQRFEEDSKIFSAALMQAYLGQTHAGKEAANDA
jgi:hypothetical protein